MNRAMKGIAAGCAEVSAEKGNRYLIRNKKERLKLDRKLRFIGGSDLKLRIVEGRCEGLNF